MSGAPALVEEGREPRYRSSIQAGRWYFGITIRRFSLFVAWKCNRTWRNYAEELRRA